MSERRSHLILVALILAGLVGVALLAVPGSPFYRKAVEGLDLQGGLEVVLKAVPPKGKPLTAAELDRSLGIMRQRVDKLGVSEPEIRKQGSDQIVLQLAGIHNPDEAARVIGKTAQLELYDFESDLTGPSTSASGGGPRALPSLFALLSPVQAEAKKGTPSAYYLFDAKKRLFRGATGVPLPPGDTRAQLLERFDGKLPKGATVLAVPGNTTVVTCPASSGCIGAPVGSSARTFYYLFKHNPNKGIPEMTGADLSLGGIRADVDTQGGGNLVRLSFTGAGNKKFHTITKAEAQRGKTAQALGGGPDQNYFQHFAIVLDNVLISTPYISYVDNPDGIDPSGGGADISNIRTFGEAKQLALVLQTGALPVRFVTIERTDVSATLGKDSLAQAKTAALYALIVVALFLLVLYRFLGLVAVIGLAIYAAFLYAAILLFHVTLTLPGFAGLILTIGVAADANVVVFERIKEEVRAGKSVRAAISAGYAKGFRTILDANVVTAITALVLFAVATAGVKGFALMLLIGTLISLVTAVAATRAMLGLLGGFRWFNNPRFMGAHGAQGAKWLQIDFMRRRYLWFAISGVIVVVGAASLATKGLNLGIDFKGGAQLTFTTTKPHTTGDVASVLSATGRRDAVVQGRGAQTSARYTSFQVRTKSLSRVEQKTLTDNLQRRVDATQPNVKNVSSSFGRQIARGALLAILFSLILIVLYISIRFDIKFAVPVILAMLHDIVITVGVYSLTGREVSTSTVAAVLTVLGYSIYDTIIIFDRIRENVPLMRKESMATITNVSLWETIRRSLATTLITLLPVGSLLLFGGTTLKDFAFALLVGITSGAYSSIFIAAPLVTIWKEREPEYARRRSLDSASRDGGGDAVLEEAEQAAAAEPTPELLPAGAPADRALSAEAKRERRRQRRRARPHGRAR